MVIANGIVVVHIGNPLRSQICLCCLANSYGHCHTKQYKQIWDQASPLGCSSSPLSLTLLPTFHSTLQQEVEQVLVLELGSHGNPLATL